MAGNSYLPAKDADLQSWANNFLAVANANLAILGLTAPDVTTVSTDKGSFDASVTNNITKQAEAKSAVENKKNVRKKFELSTRNLVNKIQANPNVTSDIKAKLGITVKDSSSSPTNPITPIGLLVNPNSNGTNKLSWNRNGNSQGTIFLVEAEDKPGNPWILIGTTTKTGFDHTNQLPGKTQYYRVRAQRSDNSSDPSNEAVAYPNQGV